MSVPAVTTNALTPGPKRSTKIAFSSLTSFQQRALREIYRFRHAPTGQGTFIANDPRKVKVKSSYRASIIAAMQLVVITINCPDHQKQKLNTLFDDLQAIVKVIEPFLKSNINQARAKMAEAEPGINWYTVTSTDSADRATLQRFYVHIKPVEDQTLEYLAKLDIQIDNFLAFFELPPDIA